MKIASNKTGLVVRLGALVAALLIGQQALAAGTRAGTVVENTATVGYEVNTIIQAPVNSNTVTFVVDRRVDFTLTLLSTPDLEPVTPGGTDYFVDFLLTNVSNSDLDFDLSLAETANGVSVDATGTDDADMGTVDYAISGNTVAGGNPDPVRGVNNGIIDELASDAAIRIRVFGDAAATLLNGQVAGVELTATAFEAGGAGLGAVLNYGGGNTDALENVDANGNGGVQIAVDGFIVEAAALSATKSSIVVSDPLGSGLVIPGAVLQYEIVVSNAAGSQAASNVVISDTIDGDVVFLDNAGGSAFTDIQVDDGGGPVECTASDADNDGCSVVGGVLTVGDPTDRPITIPANGSYTVRFQVEVPTTTPTP